MKRRVFLSGFLTASLAALCPVLQVRAEENSESSSDVWDVIVVGAGLAGLSAAVSACEAGARRVALLEKDALIGGHSIMSSGYLNAVDPKRQTPQGIDDSVEKMVRQSLEVGEFQGDPELMHIMAAHSEDAVDWLEKHGVRWSDHVFESLSSMQKRAHVSSPVRAGYDYVMALLESADRLGISVRLQHDVKRLLLENGRVCGVAGVRAGMSGKEDFSFRGNATILATGGFGANVTLREKWARGLTEGMETSANPKGWLTDGATGDGLLMAKAVGADLTQTDSILLVPYLGGRVTGYVGADIFLTPEGKRFVNEGASWSTLRDAMRALPNGRMWVLTDSASVKNNEFSGKLFSGVIRKADTLDEVADVIGCKTRVLKETVDRYNGFVRTGKDEDFGKQTLLQTIEKPPFYFGEERLNVHSTEGGLRIDAEARVLDSNHRPIPGLYAAGETVGGIHGRSRPGGNGTLACVVFGRIAGKNAAHESLSRPSVKNNPTT